MAADHPVMRRNKIAQDVPGTIFSKGALLWYPPVSTTRNLEDGFRGVNVIENFRTVEDGVDAAVPVDAKNAPTSDLENCKERSFPQRPHRSFFLQEEKERRRTLQLCQSDCLNRGVHPSNLCPFLCPPSLEFVVLWYEKSISGNCELMPGFIGPSQSVRLRTKSLRRNC
jgi:hypothetical protein